ncbi:bestrophin family ion channel [Nodularia harveyana UHCC-0300]|uniref:Bestrophin family ion channel n=1 Tax=Nodularia harveyana UHCC-0300 TaxID=2974287 RepID=A0ABU5UID7_9CYAN|nr:bestrophin family ion channel [Nodularia harveyana]MEA5583277.1 bestrophin family ion channel [Nodularia harveyana UHCC-0300]
MILEKRNWLQVALQIKGSVVPAIFPRLILCSGLGLIISVIHHYGYNLPQQIFSSVITNVAYNLVLGLLMVFRTNTAYSRYWEGRQIWGTIVINSLNLGRKIRLFIIDKESSDLDQKAAAIKMLSAFAIATKLKLRRLPVNHELADLLTPSQYLELQDTNSPPLKIALWIGDYLKQQQNQDHITILELISMNTALDKMVEGFIGCERILTTPVPLAYTIYLKRVLLIYCLILPLQLVYSLDWWTAPIVAIISFILLGVEEIAHQIENPFGLEPNDLPVDQICSKLTTNLEDLMTANLKP